MRIKGKASSKSCQHVLKRAKIIKGVSIEIESYSQH